MHARRATIAGLAAAAMVLLCLPVVLTVSASADGPSPGHSGLVPTMPRNDIPRVTDGAVLAIEASPDGSSLYVAGAFNTVGGLTKRKIVRIDPVTGAPVAGFTANASARATALAVSSTTVYVGGQFTTVNGVARESLVALNPTTGAVDTGFNLPITGGIGLNGLLTVQELKLTHDGGTLLVVHTGRQIAGQTGTASA